MTTKNSKSCHEKKTETLTPSPISDYTNQRVAGNGTFGVVYQALRTSTQELVAIKKVFQDPRYKNRELDLMLELTHPNIVRLVQHFYTEGSKPNEIFLNLIMEYVPDTLYRTLRTQHRSEGGIHPYLAKVFSYQILRSIGYCHLKGICHRDIKPQNLLVDTSTGRLVLCDFGSAKKLVQGEANIAYICSRYYRAPELVLGATEYTTAVDIWSVGCVIAEIFLGRPLFQGESAADQIVEIIKILGTPTREQMIDMNSKYSGIKVPEMKGIGLKRALSERTPPDAVEFIKELLKYDPRARPNAYQALRHEFFDEVRKSNGRLPNGNRFPCSDWNEEEAKYLNLSQYK